MTDLLTLKNTEGVNFQAPQNTSETPRHVYCEYPPWRGNCRKSPVIVRIFMQPGPGYRDSGALFDVEGIAKRLKSIGEGEY